jgi:hypothetical protein
MAKPKIKAGEVIRTVTIAVTDAQGQVWLYWTVDDGTLRDDSTSRGADALAVLNTRKCYGPFKTDAEVRESERFELLGPGCKVEEGGAWDPAWDKAQ